ncbi:MAG: alpha/beta fold hydrolase [bacterium]
MSGVVRQKSLWVPVGGKDRLHLRRIWKNPKGPPLFLIHGSVENGRVFYSENGKGLAPFLAEHGYDVYVGDLRGRGASSPAISRRSAYGQTEQITEDIPALLRALRSWRGRTPQHWIAHSWGGVLLAASYARFPEIRPWVKSMVCFASKRTIRVFNWEKFLKIDLFWNRGARLLVGLYGYLPMRELGLGADNETARSHRQNRLWIQPHSPWVDPGDGFDYAAALDQTELPPTLHLVGCADRSLGHPRDVEDFIQESHPRYFEYRILGRRWGNRQDYGHIDILTRPEAREDHFPWLLAWLKGRALPTRPGQR